MSITPNNITNKYRLLAHIVVFIQIMPKQRILFLNISCCDAALDNLALEIKDPKIPCIKKEKETSFENNNIYDDTTKLNVPTISIETDFRVASCLRNELRRSIVFQHVMWMHYHKITNKENKKLLISISFSPDAINYSIDNFGSEVQRLVNEKIEMEHVLSCLSTLGGAFSSLGDQFIHCAEIAGRISAQQFQIALKLADPNTLLRCKLYFSISLIQCGRLRNARDIIRTVYRHGKSVPEDLQDKRIFSMCLGIWAKLKYTWELNQKRCTVSKLQLQN